LKKNPELYTTILGAVAAFCTYSCMAGFRKGITAVQFEGISFGGVDYKIWLVTAQVLGYAFSKLIGVKVVSEMKPHQRPMYLLALVLFAQLALLGFAIVPAPYNIVFLFLNGLPLGMVYGIVLGFLEGRKQTEILISALTASFIFSAGLVKTVALLLMQQGGVTEFWAPFVTGILFILPTLLSVWGLSLLPRPTEEDKSLRTERLPMNRLDRKNFMRTFPTGLTLLITSYVLLTAFRDFRDYFGPEILKGAAVSNPAIFAQTETLIAFIILGLMAGLRWVHNHFQAFTLINILMAAGALLVGLSTWMYQLGLVSAGAWFMFTGLGMYMGYVPCNGLYFERLVASFRYVSTVGFIVTLADWYGYLGSVGVLLYKNFGQPSISFQAFYVYGCYVLSGFYVLLTILSYASFRAKYKNGLTVPKVVSPA
jgi:MFS family permease